jgi:hypothetical protein
MKEKTETDVSMERLPAHPQEQMWTMEDAFEWDGFDDLKSAGLDLERGIRSVAFLLQYLSEGGNEEIDGFVAQGLGRCLNFCPEKSAHLREVNILRMNGKRDY